MGGGTTVWQEVLDLRLVKMPIQKTILTMNTKRGFHTFTQTLIFLLICSTDHLARSQETVPGLRPYNEASFYIRLLDTNTPTLSIFTNAATTLSVPVPELCSGVGIASGQFIDTLRAWGVDLKVLKRKYTSQEFSVLSCAKPTKSDQILQNDHIIMHLSAVANFQMQRASDRKYITYPGYTSAFSVNIDNHKYCNESAENESPTILTVSQPVTVSGNTASIAYSTSENIDIVQRFLLEGEACRFEVTARNNDTIAHRVQVRYQFDTQIDDNDGSPLYAEPVGARVKETEVIPLSFDQWQSWLRPVRNTGDLYGIGTVATLPTRVVFAWWPNATDSAWDYAPDPNQAFYQEGYVTSPRSDSCVLYYMDLGTIQPGASQNVATAYGVATARSDSRARLIEALSQLANAMKDYQTACAAVAGDAFSKTAMTARRDQNLKDVATDMALDLVADGTMSKTAGKLFSKGVSDQFTRWLVKNIGEKAVIKGLSLGNKALSSWMWDPINGGIDPEWDRNDPEFSTTSAYIKSFILTTLAADVAHIDQVLGQTLATIADPLPEGYPLQQRIMMLQQLRADVLRLRPVKGQGKEDVVYWAIPGVLDDTLYGNYNPLLLGVSSKVAESHKLYVRTLTLGGLEDVKLLRRVGCIAWNVGGGAVKIVGHIGSVATGPGAIPIGAGIEGLYWSGVGVCGTAGAANTVVDVIGKVYAVFQLGLDLESVQSDIEYASSTFETVANAVVAAQTLEGSLQMSTTAVDADDVEVGWLDLFGNGHAKVTVSNSGASHDGYCRVFATISRKNALTGAYNDLVSTSTSGFRLSPNSSSVADLSYDVPVGIVMADRYLVEFNIITSSGYFYRSAFFRACNPAACWVDDQITRVATGTLTQGQRATGTINTSGTGGATEVTLAYPGSDFDLHVYDNQGRHVGMNYSQGTVEVNIPGSYYSGPSSCPETIRIPQSQVQGLRYEIVAVESAGSEGYDLYVTREGTRNATLVSMPRVVEVACKPGLTVVAFGLAEVGGQNDANSVSVTCSGLTNQLATISAESVTFSSVPAQVVAGSNAFVGMLVTLGSEVQSGTYTGLVSVTWNGGSLRVPVLASVQGGQIVQDVTTNVTTFYNSWRLDPASGALIATIAMSNSNSKAGIPLEKVFWYAITETSNIRLANPTGITNGMRYVDVTSAVEAQLPFIGNGDLKLDVGESVTFTVAFYSRDLSIPTGHVFGIWADPPLISIPGRMTLSALRQQADGRLRIRMTGAAGTVCVVEASSDMAHWMTIGTVTNVTGTAEFLDRESPQPPHRFYRVRSQ